MIPKQKGVSKSLQRLLNLFATIEDENIREIIADTVVIESRYRSSSRKNFPWKDVRSIVDRVASLSEKNGEMEDEA